MRVRKPKSESRVAFANAIYDAPLTPPHVPELVMPAFTLSPSTASISTPVTIIPSPPPPPPPPQPQPQPMVVAAPPPPPVVVVAPPPPAVVEPVIDLSGMSGDQLDDLLRKMGYGYEQPEAVPPPRPVQAETAPPIFFERLMQLSLVGAAGALLYKLNQSLPVQVQTTLSTVSPAVVQDLGWATLR